MSALAVVINGRSVELQQGATVADALELLDLPAQRGFAVAVDAEVIPRGEWQQRKLAPDDRVEIVTAIQGG
ncbi:MAG: sulfur carrier protein ThiS [Solirubrobacteraceae bacterium]